MKLRGIQINDHFRYDSSKVETIEFHDGSTLDISNADQLIPVSYTHLYTDTPATTRLLAAKEMTAWKAVMEMIPTSGT